MYTETCPELTFRGGGNNMIELYAYGKCKTEGVWWVDSSKVVNRLYYVISGSAVVKCGTEFRTLTEGNVYILPQINGFSPIGSENFEHIFFDYYSVPALHPHSFAKVSGNVCNLDGFFSFFGSVINNCTVDIARHFLCAVLGIIESNVKLEYINDSTIIRALEIIHNKDIGTVKELANRVSLNESYFIRLFSRTVGTTPMKYLRSYRLSEGRLMLKNGCSVSQAAEKCGYMTPASFSKAMRLEFGCSPKSFK